MSDTHATETVNPPGCICRYKHPSDPMCAYTLPSNGRTIEDAERSCAYWKAEHLHAVNHNIELRAEIERLRGELAEWQRWTKGHVWIPNKEYGELCLLNQAHERCHTVETDAAIKRNFDPFGARPTEKATSSTCSCGHDDGYHFDNGLGYIICRATLSCGCSRPTEKASEPLQAETRAATSGSAGSQIEDAGRPGPHGYTCRKCGIWYAGPNGFHNCAENWNESAK